MSPAKSHRQTAVSVFVFCALCTVWVCLSQISLNPFSRSSSFLGPDGVLAPFENMATDARFKLRGSIDSPFRVCYVDIDTDSIARLGNFPWNRAYFAIVLDALFSYGQIKAAGLDFVFSMAGIPALGRDEALEGSKALGKSIHKHQNVVLAATFGTKGFFPFVFQNDGKDLGEVTPELPGFPVVGPTWGHVGLIDTVGNDIRYIPFFAKMSNHTYLPMSLKMALLYWGLDESAVGIEANGLTVRKNNGSVSARIPLRMGQLVEPNWFGAWMEKDHHASFVQVMAFGQAMQNGTEEEKQLAREFFAPFKDSLVLIGPVDPLLKDISPMPLDGSHDVPRVAVHGNLLKMILSGRFIHRPPVWLNCALIYFLGFAAAAFCLVPQSILGPARMGGVLVVAGYVLAAFFLFSWMGLLAPMVAPLGAALSCSFAGTLIHLSQERRQKRRIKNMFGTYLSHSLVEKMLESGEEPKLGGIDAEITAFFSDVQGFSNFSELLTPQQLVALMNEYLSAMTNILMECGCYVDKYIGDAIVGIFNAPVTVEHHALKACMATQLLHKRLAELRVKWASEGDKWPPFVSRMQMRIGLNTGHATVGNMGSERRFNYTMMGDMVNLAARCESGSKAYGAYTMVTGETKRAAEAAGNDCVFRFLDNIVVKGRSGPVDMYEVVCLRRDLNFDAERCIALYAEGIEHYRSLRWNAAIDCFERSALLEPHRHELNPDSPTTPSLVMIHRTRHLMQNPPGPDWNGVYVMKSK
ncbi:MAG: adenylate/guanylate cyclase domain-containing protein [bacterium]